MSPMMRQSMISNDSQKAHRKINGGVESPGQQLKSDEESSSLIGSRSN